MKRIDLVQFENKLIGKNYFITVIENNFKVHLGKYLKHTYLLLKNIQYKLFLLNFTKSKIWLRKNWQFTKKVLYFLDKGFFFN